MLAPGLRSQQTARASAALPAAGAWDAAPVELFSTGAESVTLHMTYTRGGAGGAVDFQMQVSPYSLLTLAPASAAEWQHMTQYTAGVLAAGVDTQSREQREYITYQAVGATTEAFVYGPVDLAERIERIRVTARESGNAGAPGTFAVTAMFR